MNGKCFGSVQNNKAVTRPHGVLILVSLLSVDMGTSASRVYRNVVRSLLYSPEIDLFDPDRNYFLFGCDRTKGNHILEGEYYDDMEQFIEQHCTLLHAERLSDNHAITPYSLRVLRCRDATHVDTSAYLPREVICWCDGDGTPSDPCFKYFVLMPRRLCHENYSKMIPDFLMGGEMVHDGGTFCIVYGGLDIDRNKYDGFLQRTENLRRLPQLFVYVIENKWRD